MRFCPFCSAENPSEATHCATCARRLPPLPPRRQRTGAVPTGVVQVGDAAQVGVASPMMSTTPGAAPAPGPAPPPEERRPQTHVLPAPSALRRTVPPEPRTDAGQVRRRTDAGAAPAPPPPQAMQVVSLPAPSTLAPTPEPAEKLPPPPTVPAPPIIPTTSPATSSQGTPTPSPLREVTSVDPPATRIVRPQELADRPFTPPRVLPIPEVPEPGLLNSVRYSIAFLRARWQRRGAIKALGEEIKQDTAALDLVLGTLGHQARALKIDNRALASENAAITAAEDRKTKLDQANAELSSRKADETAKFEEIERDRMAKASDAERVLDEANTELTSYEGQRRSLRDKRKEVERRQKAYLKAAEDRDNESSTSPMGDARSELRRVAEGHRREAASLEPERQELDRKLSALERPLSTAQAKVDAARAELESARRSLNDAREGYRHRLAEIEAEQGRKTRELAQAESEIQRRLVTLGTLINLNRIEDPGFAELYERIDRLRMAIGARTTEIDKLTAEREAYDKGSLVRGFVTLGGGVVVVITLFVILLAVL